jgi:hypothetical protein
MHADEVRPALPHPGPFEITLRLQDSQRSISTITSTGVGSPPQQEQNLRRLSAMEADEVCFQLFPALIHIDVNLRYRMINSPISCLR